MAGNENHVDEKSNTAALTSERLRDMVLDHMLDNANVFLADDMNISERFLKMLDSLSGLAEQIATQSITNRVRLSTLPTFSGSILPDPEEDPNDDQLYELRYRVIEQIGENEPHKDDVLTLQEAHEIYGESFVENYWGRLGEKCPNKMTTNQDRHLWFTVVRYPIADVAQDNAQRANVKAGPRLR